MSAGPAGANHGVPSNGKWGASAEVPANGKGFASAATSSTSNGAGTVSASGSGSLASGSQKVGHMRPPETTSANPVAANSAGISNTTPDGVGGLNTGGCKRPSSGSSSTTRGRKKQKMKQVCTPSLQHACILQLSSFDVSYL